MALITRVSNLFKADLHAVLDRIEEPELMLKQAIREMEEELARDERRLKLLEHESRQLTSRQNDLEQSLRDIEEQLDICLAADNDDLARVLVKRKLEAQRLLKFLSRKRTSLAEAMADLKQRLNENKVRLDSVRQKAELLEEEEPARAGDDWGAPDFAVGDADVEVALMREKQKRSRP